jgi:type IV pilus assembly protein PilF
VTTAKMDKIFRVILPIIFISLLSSCVTKNYENNDDQPVIENNSTNNEIAMTRISLGLGYLKMGNTTQAKLNLEKAKRFAPKLTQVYTAYAHYYDTVDEPELAISSYEKALSFDNKDADTLNN